MCILPPFSLSEIQEAPSHRGEDNQRSWQWKSQRGAGNWKLRREIVEERGKRLFSTHFRRSFHLERSMLGYFLWRKQIKIKLFTFHVYVVRDVHLAQRVGDGIRKNSSVVQKNISLTFAWKLFRRPATSGKRACPIFGLNEPFGNYVASFSAIVNLL